MASYFGEDPHQQLDDNLRRFNQMAKTGAVVRSEGAPDGKRAHYEFPQHPARPLSATGSWSRSRSPAGRALTARQYRIATPKPQKVK